MLRSHRLFNAVAILMLAVLAGNAAVAMTAQEAVELIATRLDQSQIKDGPDAGLWPLEMTYLGPIATGMASAYEWAQVPAYRSSAELAGEWILATAVAQGNLFGDEAHALVNLSEMAEDPNHNIWQNALVDFFASPRKVEYEGSTEVYLQVFDELEPSTATFYLAHYLVAADYVEDPDVDIYRRTLIAHLSRVSDEATFPVMALGAATWALTLTDSPAETFVAAHEVRPYPSYWDGVTVGDLPELLASHQVPGDELFGGSFYWRLDHTDGGTGGVVSGYTEDTVFGTLGLVAVASKSQAEPGDEIHQAILAAQEALLHGVDETGQVYEHLTRNGAMYNTFSGEMMQVLWSIDQYLNRDVPVDDTDPEAGAE